MRAVAITLHLKLMKQKILSWEEPNAAILHFSRTIPISVRLNPQKLWELSFQSQIPRVIIQWILSDHYCALHWKSDSHPPPPPQQNPHGINQFRVEGNLFVSANILVIKLMVMIVLFVALFFLMMLACILHTLFLFGDNWITFVYHEALRTKQVMWMLYGQV